MDIDTTFFKIVDGLGMLCCPRCMTVADVEDSDAWEFVIVDDVGFEPPDVACGDCVTEYDLTRPDRPRFADLTD